MLPVSLSVAERAARLFNQRRAAEIYESRGVGPRRFEWPNAVLVVAEMLFMRCSFKFAGLGGAQPRESCRQAARNCAASWGWLDSYWLANTSR